MTTLPAVPTGLTIPANRRVLSLLEGRYASVFHSRSMDFEDLRDYQPGDEVRDIDWKATARSQQPLVRRHVSGRQLRLMLIVGTGAQFSALSAGGDSKREIAAETAGLLGLLAVRGGDSVRLVSGSGQATTMSAAASTTSQLAHLIEAIRTEPAAGDVSTVLDRIEWVGRHVRDRLLVVVISDELDMPPHAGHLLRRLTLRHESLWATVSDADPLALAAEGARPYDVLGRGRAALPDELAGDTAVIREYAAAEAARRTAFAETMRVHGITHTRIDARAGVLGSVRDLLEEHRRGR